MMVVAVGTLAKSVCLWSARLVRLFGGGTQPIFVSVDTEEERAVGDVPLSGVEEIDNFYPEIVDIPIALPPLVDLIAAIDQGRLPELSPYRAALEAAKRAGEGAGARNLPALGAAAAIFHEQALRRSLTTALRRAVTDRGCQVVLVRLETGGTGTGATPFVARILREVAEANGIALRLFLVSIGSPLFAGGSEVRAYANLYAARKELQAYDELDAIFVVEDVVPAGGLALEAPQVLGQVALFLALLVTSDLGNFLLQRFLDEAVDFVRPGLVWSFGLSTLYAPLKEGFDWANQLMTARLVERLLSGNGDPQPADLEFFCRSIGLDETPARLCQDLDTNGRGLPLKATVLEMADFRSRDWLNGLVDIESKLSAVDNALAEGFTENAQRFLDTTTQCLSDALPQLCRRFGLKGVLQGLERALQRLGEWQRQAVENRFSSLDLFPPGHHRPEAK